MFYNIKIICGYQKKICNFADVTVRCTKSIKIKSHGPVSKQSYIHRLCCPWL